MATNSDWTGAARSEDADDLRALAGWTYLQSDRTRVRDIAATSESDPGICGNRAAPAPPRFSNRFSPPEHRDCIDPLCLVCIEAEVFGSEWWNLKRPGPFLLTAEEYATREGKFQMLLKSFGDNAGSLLSTAKVLKPQNGRQVIECGSCKLIQFEACTHECRRCRRSFWRVAA